MITHINGTSRWTMWSSIVGSAIFAFGFMCTVAYQVVNVSVTQTWQATKNDEIFRRLDLLRGDVELLRLNNTEQRSALVEIETQFCANDTARNLSHSHDLRLFAVLWQQTFGTPFPIENAYYPQICTHGKH